jgi:hypothetical protein
MASMNSDLNPQSSGVAVWFIATLFVVYSFTLNTATPAFIGKINEAIQIPVAMALLYFIRDKLPVQSNKPQDLTTWLASTPLHIKVLRNLR